MRKTKYKKQTRRLVYLIPIIIILVLLLIIAFIGYSKITGLPTLTTQDITDTIPSDRYINWSESGVSGGIPNRTTICATINSATYGNGVTDATSAIQTAINNCPANQVVYLPAGTYLINDTISPKSNITLRGAGPNITTILTNTNIGTMVIIGTTPYSLFWNTGIDIVSGYTKGSTQLAFANSSAISSISVGDFITIDDVNNDTLPVMDEGSGGSPCTWCGRPGWDVPGNVTVYNSTSGTFYNVSGQGGWRSRGQAAQVIGKSGANISISPALYFTSSSMNFPQIARWGDSVVQYAGLESLTLNNQGGFTKMVELSSVANSWVKNVDIEKCGSRCLVVGGNAFRNEIVNNYVHECYDHQSSNTCYATIVDIDSSANLIENNIYNYVSSVMISHGASGNVIAYNYLYEAHRTQSEIGAFWPDLWSHGAHPMFNLFEGNEGNALSLDWYWGSNSHTTIFRNWFRSRDPLGDSYYLISDLKYVLAINLEKNSHYDDIVGNVLGWNSTWNTYYEKESVNFTDTDRMIYREGYDAGEEDNQAVGNDHAVFTTLFRQMNYDYNTQSTKYCSDAGEPGCQGTSGSRSLPNSLYLASKPSWFGNIAWPPIGPDLTPMVSRIPARTCFEDVMKNGTLPFNPDKCYTLSTSGSGDDSNTGKQGNPSGGASGGGGGGGSSGTTKTNAINVSGTVGTAGGTNQTTQTANQQTEAAGSVTTLSKAAQFISSVKNYLIIFAIVLILAIAIVWVVMARKARTERLRGEMFEQVTPNTTDSTDSSDMTNFNDSTNQEEQG